MISEIEKAIKQYHMLDGVRSVAVGVSGGADSVCLLHYLSSVRERYAIILKAVHVNHGIRGEQALRDEKFVCRLCEKLNVPLSVFHKNVPEIAARTGMGLEQCGRAVRYEIFAGMNCDAVAVAHTLSDSLETAIFNLARGTSLSGLCGIKAKRGSIIRPLIFCTRQMIEDYCRENGLDYVVDSTNFDVSYSRNRIRHEVMPSLKKLNPELEKSALRMFQTLECENSYMNEQARALLDSAQSEEGFSLQTLRSAHRAVLSRACMTLLSEHMQKPAQSRHVQLVLDVIENGGMVRISEREYAAAKKGRLVFIEASKKTPQFCSPVQNGRAQTPLGTVRVVIKEGCPESARRGKIICADADRLCGALFVRNRAPGDFIRLQRRNVTKTLKKLFNELGLSEAERSQTLILSDESNEIIILENIGVNEKYQPTEETKRIVYIERGENKNERQYL